MEQVAIRVENISKRYQIGELQSGCKKQKYRTLRESMVDVVSKPIAKVKSLLNGNAYAAAGLNQEMWALKNISFEVKPGEVLAIIGRNGAGKSTLLKILSRITQPTHGHAELRGRVGSLLEVGTGFHPELTGRENIFLSAAILGMTKAEIKKSFDEIVSFAEIERYIDTPVKHYSSGMYLRLAFSVAAHLRPEIMLVDEVLAVGDATFQKKCLDKMGEVAKAGRTIIFISHNMAATENLCPRAILLNNGEVMADGDTRDVINSYTSMFEDETSHPDFRTHPGRAKGMLPVIAGVRTINSKNEVSRTFDFDEDIEIEIDLDPASISYQFPSVAVQVVNHLGLTICRLPTWATNLDYSWDLSTPSTVRLKWHNCRLFPGKYYLCLSFANGKVDVVDLIEPFGSIEIMPTGSAAIPLIKTGIVLPKYEWYVKDKEAVEIPIILTQ